MDNDSFFALVWRRVVDHWRAPASFNGDDRRLMVSGVPVFLALSLIFGAIYSEQVNPLLWEDAARVRKARADLLVDQKKKIYPVLISQKYAPKKKTDQFRALSDVTAEGTGGITKRKGFHTLTPHDELDPGQNAAGSPGSPARPRPTPERANQKAKERAQGDQPKRAKTPERKQKKTPTYQPGKPGRGQTGKQYKIPANYRFQQDFALRYDSSRRLSIARQELAGFAYFQRMLRQIGQSWSLPGSIYSYRDHYGRVSNQPVAPQVVKVLFVLDPDGRVRDVRVVASMREERVDESCLSALRGQNFGPPPPEVLEQGNIFGINFIIPNVMR